MCDTTNDCKCHGYPERSWLQFLILRVLYERPTHGYEIIRSIDNISLGRHKIKTGTMYTTLRRMEKEGILESTWMESVSGPDSRKYFVTKKGTILLRTWLENIIERKKMIDQMVEFYHLYFTGDT